MKSLSKSFSSSIFRRVFSIFTICLFAVFAACGDGGDGDGGGGSTDGGGNLLGSAWDSLAVDMPTGGTPIDWGTLDTTHLVPKNPLPAEAYSQKTFSGHFKKVGGEWKLERNGMMSYYQYRYPDISDKDTYYHYSESYKVPDNNAPVNCRIVDTVNLVDGSYWVYSWVKGAAKGTKSRISFEKGGSGGVSNYQIHPDDQIDFDNHLDECVVYSYYSYADGSDPHTAFNWYSTTRGRHVKYAYYYNVNGYDYDYYYDTPGVYVHQYLNYTYPGHSVDDSLFTVPGTVTFTESS